MRLWQGLSQLHKLLEWIAAYLGIAFLSGCFCCIHHACRALTLQPRVSACLSPQLVQTQGDHHGSCSLISLPAKCMYLVIDLPDGVQTDRAVQRSLCLHPSQEGLYVLQEIFEGLADLFPIYWESSEAHDYSQTNYLLPDTSDNTLLHAHLTAVVAHLHSPEKWQYFEQHGFHRCVEFVSATAKKCEGVWRGHPVNAWHQVWPDPQPYCNLLIAVLGECGLEANAARSCVADVLCTPPSRTMFTLHHVVHVFASGK